MTSEMQNSLTIKSQKTESYFQRFIFGGISCMCGSLATNPIDVIKVRLQIQGELSTTERGISLSRVYGSDKQYRGFVHGMYTIARQEGVKGLYKGLTASLLREATYSTLRIGFYDVFKDLLKASDPKHTPLWKKIISGALAGALGAAIANPTDLVKVRLQASSSDPSSWSCLISDHKQHVSDFKLTWRMFFYTFQHEGLRGLYRGVGPTTQRAALLTAAQLGSYDHIKHFLLNLEIGFKENPLTHFTASMMAGFISAAVTSPVDVVKTRVMKQFVRPDGTRQYKNTFDCMAQILKTEGLFGFYKGFIPNWLRIGPHTIITFIIYEQLRRLAGIRPI